MQTFRSDLGKHLPGQIRTRLGLLEQVLPAHIDLGLLRPRADNGYGVADQDKRIPQARNRDLFDLDLTGPQGLGDLFHCFKQCGGDMDGDFDPCFLRTKTSSLSPKAFSVRIPATPFIMPYKEATNLLLLVSAPSYD